MSANTTPGGDGGYNSHGGQGQLQGHGIDHRDNGKSLGSRLSSRFGQIFKDFGKGTSVAAAGAGYGGQLPVYPTSTSSSSVHRQQCDSSATGVSSVLLTAEIIDELGKSHPLQVRLKALQAIIDTCKSRRVEPRTIEKVWSETVDIFAVKDSRARHTNFHAFVAILEAQSEKPEGFLRATIFNFIQSHDNPEDTLPRFQLLKVLTNNGKDASYFEDSVGQFLFKWMNSRRLYQVGDRDGVKVEDFMGLLTNVIKHYSRFLDDDVLGGIIQHTCITALECNQPADALACINLLNNIVSYSMIHPNFLTPVICALCRTVNIEPLCDSSWKLMRNLLGTTLGYSSLHTLIKNVMQISETAPSSSSGVGNGGGTLENGTTETDDVEKDSLIRGAVFFTGVALWGSGNRAVRTLTRGSMAGSGGGIVGVVLGAYTNALKRNHTLVTYEVLLRVQDLIQHNPDSLQVYGWEMVLGIMRKIITFSKEHQHTIGDATLVQLERRIHETLNQLEVVLPTKTFCGNAHSYWEDVVEPIYYTRPVSSIEALLSHKYTRLLDASSSQFMPNLVQFTLLHFQKEVRPQLRLMALGHIKKICLMNQDSMEEALLDSVILPNLKNVETEADLNVREHCVQFLVEFLMESRSKKGHDLLLYIEKVVNRPFELDRETSREGGSSLTYTEDEVIDVMSGIQGIICIFQRKIYSLPSSIAVTAFKILVRHLEKHYKAKNCLENCATIRFKIFECFFQIRANALYHLGFLNEHGVVPSYSPYLAVDHKDSSMESSYQTALDHHQLGGISPPTMSTNDPKSGPPLVSYISLTAACKQVISCLKKEREWKILELVFLQLPVVMENKALIVSKHGNDVDNLAAQLCNMVNDKALFSAGDTSAYRNTPARFSRSDFQAHVFPALTSLVSYHSSLDIKTQQNIVKCLEQGLVSKSGRICITALTTCVLEMKQAMHKLIPEILLSLSKLSPKLNIAIPVLEFLSTLIHLSRVYHSFVSDQYMSIFAICLPYTNPFKFNHYVVSLAHHVIALWFLKCRLSFRKGFVSYIIKGLESNVWAPYMEAAAQKQLVNEDSSNRKRSSSLTDQTNRRRERIVSGQAGAQGLSRQTSYQQHSLDSINIQFHQELTETCVDLMARYAFADCAPVPSRFESAGWLTQHGGNSQSWMVDNRIITIATSGCTTKEMKEGVCDRCWVVCKQNNQAAGSGEGRRRSLLVGQHSYDDQEVKGESSGLSSGGGIRRSNTISGGQQHHAGSAIRRRHRSALVQQGQLQIPSQEDNLLEHKLDKSSHDGSTDSGGGRGARKDGSGICMCWCQGWAEILVRRPTGNTSWMMRVQNVIVGGGHSHQDSEERLMSNLCGIYVNDILERAKKELDDVDGDSWKTSKEELERSQENVTGASLAGSVEEMSLSTSCSVEAASSTGATSATGTSTPDKGQTSPTVEEGGSGSKLAVKRSNSSPEMAKGGGADHQDDDSQKGYLPSCGPIPEETTRKSESEGESNVHLSNLGKKSVTPSSTALSATTDILQNSLTPMRRDRTSTISVMTPARKNPAQPSVRRMMSAGSGDISRPSSNSSTSHPSGDPGIRSGISPSFIFLQLCGQGFFGANGGSSKPVPLPSNESTTNSLKVLDYIPPYETHKIGVLYVGPGQATNETKILQNSHGSLRYQDFLQGLGTLIKLSETDPHKTFLGGLDGRGSGDGDFAYIWRDDVMQVIFHVATLMPTSTTDPNCNGKKRHIGNDFVSILYNNSDEEFDIATFKCQFMYACVIIQPLDHQINRIYVKTKPMLGENSGNTDVKIVSDENLPIMARQLALHCNLASVIQQKLMTNAEPYASNWLERLRGIKRLKQRVIDSGSNASPQTGPPGSSQELIDSLTNSGLLRPGGSGHGSSGSVAGLTQNSGGNAAGGGIPKRNSFVVDDFTEYV